MKVMAFLVKRAGLELSEFIDHYENRHVPLILSLAPPPTDYRRNYVSDDAAGFDVITELTFPDEAAYRAWVSTMYAPGSGVAEDEARFLDRDRTRSYVVHESVTP